MQARLLITVTQKMHDHQYTTAGLMMDESFRAWIYNTDPAAVKQWEQWLLAHPDQQGLVTEAKALLLHTDWSVADIAYSLGFEYTTYFNNYFKKQTGHTPLSLRKLSI